MSKWTLKFRKISHDGNNNFELETQAIAEMKGIFALIKSYESHICQ